MKHVQFVLTLALALLLVAVPVMAQTATTPSAPSGAADTEKKDAQPSAAPATDTEKKDAGQASPAMPASAEECKDDGWKKFGLKDEAECLAQVKQ